MKYMLFVRVVIAVGLFATVTGASAQPPLPKKDDVVGKVVTKKEEPVPKKEELPPAQLKSFVVKNGNPIEIQTTLLKHFGAQAVPQPYPNSKPALPRRPMLVALDAKSNTLFIRGTETDLEIAAKVIAILDVTPEKMKVPGPGLQVFQLQHTTLEEVSRVLGSLELGAMVQLCPTAKILLVAPGDPNADQIRAVVERLDVKPVPKVNPISEVKKN